MHLVHDLKTKQEVAFKLNPCQGVLRRAFSVLAWTILMWYRWGSYHEAGRGQSKWFVFQSKWFEIFYRRPRVWEEIRNTHRELFSPRYMMSSSLTPWSKWWSTPCLPLPCSRLRAKSGECRSNKNSYFLICHQVVGIQQGIGLVTLFREDINRKKIWCW